MGRTVYVSDMSEPGLLPGRWIQLSRTYTAFGKVPTPAWCEFRVNMQVTADRAVGVYATSWLFSHRDPDTNAIVLEYDQCAFRLRPSDESVGMARAVADGSATLGILADWVEDDPANRVLEATLPRHERHRTSDDAVTHLLTLMRCHNPQTRRKRK